MAINKKALLRYKVLDRCFRNTRRNYTIEDLHNECCKALQENGTDGVSIRQTKEDIAFMISTKGWEIELDDKKDGRKKIYRYADPNFSIYNSPLGAEDISLLKETVKIISHNKGLPQLGTIDLKGILSKLDSKQDDVAKPIIEFDNNQDLEGIKYLEEIYFAIKEKVVLNINYKSFKTKDAYKATIHPYFLKEYNKRWFLFGYNPFFENLPICVMALDRMVGITTAFSTEYIENNTIKWDEYFDDIIGVTLTSSDIEKVVLHFTEEAFHYVKTKPIHRTQNKKITEIKDKDGNKLFKVSIKVKLNYELESLLLSFGDNVTVIEPQALRDKIQSRLKSATKKYE